MYFANIVVFARHAGKVLENDKHVKVYNKNNLFLSNYLILGKNRYKASCNYLIQKIFC